MPDYQQHERFGVHYLRPTSPTAQTIHAFVKHGHPCHTRTFLRDWSASPVGGFGDLFVGKGADAAAATTITVAGSGLGYLLAQAGRREREAELAATMPQRLGGKSPFPNANDLLIPAPGTRLAYTPLKDHYKVFIQLTGTVIDGAGWTLPITGLVENPASLTLDDIRNNHEARE